MDKVVRIIIRLTSKSGEQVIQIVTHKVMKVEDDKLYLYPVRLNPKDEGWFSLTTLYFCGTFEGEDYVNENLSLHPDDAKMFIQEEKQE